MIKREQSPATLQTIADVAGVHRSTASRALNPATAHLVSADLLERIRSVAERQEYMPNIVAAGLTTSRTRIIGVVLPDIANPVFAPILDGIESVLSSSGYSTLVANAGQDIDRQLAIIDQLRAHRVEGVMLATSRADDDPGVSRCIKAGLNVVLVNRTETASRVPAVVSDDRKGMTLAVEHLIHMGHRAIGHVAGPQHLSTGQLRLAAFGETMRAAGLSAESIVYSAGYTQEAGQVAAAHLLDQNPALTAIAAANDMLAIGVYRELRARAIECPGRISVTGHNDMGFLDILEPALTTVRIAHRNMGERAATLLLRQIRNEMVDSATELVKPTLVVRASVIAAPQGDLFGHMPREAGAYPLDKRPICH